MNKCLFIESRKDSFINLYGRSKNDLIFKLLSISIHILTWLREPLQNVYTSQLQSV